MIIQIKEVEIFDHQSVFHNQKINVYVEDGMISRVTNDILKSDKVIEGQNLKLSPGWVDMCSFFADPGYEYKEDLRSGRSAAVAGGFTEVVLLPNTNPVVQTKNEISYIKSQNAHNLVQLLPIGAITLNTKGEELTEMIDMHHAGAIAFSDGFKPIWHTDILLKSLQYLQQLDALLINKPIDKFLTLYGNMHEGIKSTLLGLKGMPRLAEEIMIMRDLKILEYAGGKIHFSNISTSGSVELIRAAKKKGVAVTCDVVAHQLIFDDSELESFDTYFKVNPPFRERSDIDSLVEGLQDDTIDAIVSGHFPQDEESKNLEFDLAEFGAVGLQTVLPALVKIAHKVPLGKLLEKLTFAPRNILKLKNPIIQEGETANLTIFDTNKEWVFNDSTNKSKSRNSPFYKRNLTGKVVAVFNNNRSWVDEL